MPMGAAPKKSKAKTKTRTNMKTILKNGGRRVNGTNGSAVSTGRPPVGPGCPNGRQVLECAGARTEGRLALSKNHETQKRQRAGVVQDALATNGNASELGMRTPSLDHPVLPSAPRAASLTNTHGFWELTLFGQRAAVRHHPALFFVAWLLDHAPAKPVSALELAARVFVRFQAHDDLLASLPWLCRQQGDADVKKVLDRKQKQLEKLLDAPGTEAAVKAEAQHEIIFIEHLRVTYFVELLPPGVETGARIWNLLFDLQTRLATATDAQGRPHELNRALGRHLLLRLVMPSVKASKGEVRFVYQPAE